MNLYVVKSTSVIAMFAICACALGSLSSCDVTESTRPEPQQKESTSAIGTDILTNAHAQALIGIRNYMTAQVLQTEPDIEDLRDAYLSQDTDEIQSLMGFSVLQIDSLDSLLEYHRAGLINAFPELAQCADEIVFPDETEYINQFFDNFDYYILAVQETAIPEKPSKTASDRIQATAVDCQWGPYFATLVACGFSGPIAYWICAYVAICSFCSGGWVDDACGKDIKADGGSCGSQ